MHLSAWVKKLLEILELKKDFTEKNTLLEVANSGFKIMPEILELKKETLHKKHKLSDFYVLHYL